MSERFTYWPADPTPIVGEPRYAVGVTCGFVWNDARITSITPAPSARCPNEYGHRG